MDFPPFEHLLYYERVHGARLNISYSNIREFHLDGFGRTLPKDLDLNWTFRNGTPELRRLIARRHRTSSKQVLVTTGATEGNFLVNAGLVHPRDRVLVDAPIYSPLRDVPRGVGANVIENPARLSGWMATRLGPLAEVGGTKGAASRIREPEQSDIDGPLPLRHTGAGRYRGGVRRPRAGGRDVPRARGR